MSETNTSGTILRKQSITSSIKGKCLLAISDEEKRLFFDKGKLDPQLDSAVNQIFQVSPATISEEDWLRLLWDYKPDVIVGAWSTRSLPVDFPLESHPLKYVCMLTGGIRRIVPKPLIERGLIASNWGSSISRTIAECALMFILMSLRRTAHWHEKMHREGAWQVLPANPGQFSLFKRKVGIHGFGNIARELVLLLRAFDVTISSHCTSIPDSLFAEYDVTRVDSLEDLFSQNDIIVEMSALTKENRHSVTEDLLRSIPDDGVFINVGRGALVDEEALIRVAREKRIRIALDVYETEPLPADSPLRQMNHVIIMPHQAGSTADRFCDAGAHAIMNLKNYMEGTPIVAAIDHNLYDYVA